MEVYLIRHTTPDIKKGQCYGQADLDITESFEQEAQCIRPHLPQHISHVFSSPLQRCRKLAEFLFPNHAIRFEDRLKEINCGDWELKLWDEIEPDYLKRWMDDFVNVCIPGGESYLQLYDRVVSFFETLPRKGAVAVVAHGGVIRSILSHVEQVALHESFNVFSLRYGCVVRVHLDNETLTHSVLHNPPAEKEQHRPTKI
ncbi:alpha-ribazole phosphatase [Cnuella takakiae]|uniref:Alpha-ribazole phosphatase n=1 Tax=Cnuella takakiae TaxID=1302690 RepID=A0A1M5E348_9BACT|nr:alpha-ribazole phosphatase [Cnuella takakiae]OLY93794.1 alpha-ribazole phosphatase [Cnuella takakiae]SHF73590.1 alpha-ribazole phosphatase [Cnuella takakiae]